MRNSFKKFCGQIKCVEVGLGDGSNAVDMLKALPYASFVLVDNYDVNNPTFQFGYVLTPKQREDFIITIKNKLLDCPSCHRTVFGDRVKLIIEDSVVASQQFVDKYFDYIYVDGEHDEDSVYRDIKAWFPKLKIGGIIGGHDVGDNGVKTALERFFGKGNWEEMGEDWIVCKLTEE